MTAENYRQNIDKQSTNRTSAFTEGKEKTKQTTMMTQSYTRPGFLVLRTVPVLLTNGDRSIQVNDLLDDASTKTYVNADVAAELRLQGRNKKVTVNVLNGQVETFETKPVSVGLKSVTGDVSMIVNAYTVNTVTGNMPVVDWNNYKQRWPHLRHNEFPCSSRRPIVDMQIGLDCAELHFALQEVRSRPGQHIARLTPLGWTCIGNLDPNFAPVLQTNFTYFERDQTELEKLNNNLKKFWEIENVSSTHELLVVRIEEQMTLKKVKTSLAYENQRYRVGVPWKTNTPVLPNNHAMALQRLVNTEKRLKRSPDVAHAYNKCLEQYVEKSYVSKVPEQERIKFQWYLPHFPVLRPEKDTTKVRIVFDALAKYDGISMNDMLYQGPKLQRDLFDVLLWFRRRPVAVVCDIAEMYLQIGIAAEDKLYHRFLWRGMGQDRQPDIYEFDRVGFGVNSSPFQAQFVLHNHARKFEASFPMAAERF